MDVEELSARLDRQAEFIKKLAARIRVLEGATPSTDTFVFGAPSTGHYVPRPVCLMCGKPKGPGRVELTCKPCGIERKRIIQTKGADRSSILTSACKNCDKTYKPSTRILCEPCSESFRAWKGKS